MFYTYILRSLSQPEQRYIGSTADLKACLAIRRFFLLAKVLPIASSFFVPFVPELQGFIENYALNRESQKWTYSRVF